MLTKDIEWYLERLRVEEVPQRGVVLGSVSGVVDDAGGSRGLVAFDVRLRLLLRERILAFHFGDQKKGAQI
ncbi:Os01g0848832 [Oryza sativa Japonica Group]|jgi:hypothetical protein|uniref:Os01g0848832 protein n=1 Tax=Oryza sativa subsp. japonica TaxID=39947 RepID=A0A0P0VAG4_ORYSJ|nr:Os01g0848832 [Oryza sativa Japonica Group]